MGNILPQLDVVLVNLSHVNPTSPGKGSGFLTQMGQSDTLSLECES